MYFYRLLTLLLLLMTSNMYISSQTPCGFFNPVLIPFPTGSAPVSIAYSPLIGTNTLYAAVANGNDNTVSVYSVDTILGEFTEVSGSPFLAGTIPVSVAYSPLIGTNTLYAAVVNNLDDTVSVYSVNTSTGVFTQVTGSPFLAGVTPVSVAFSPLIGTNTFYAAVANGGNNVSVYSVDASTGVFTQVTGSPFAAGSAPVSVAFSPLIGTNTLYAAVANQNAGTVSVYSVNTSTGVFTQVSGSPFGTGLKPLSIAYSPLIGANILYAAVVNGNGNTVSVYSVDISTGAFAQVTGSPFVTGSGPFSVAYSPLIGTSTLYAAVANSNDNTIAVYSVDLGPVVQLKAFPNPIKSGESSELTLTVTGAGPFTVLWSDGATQTGNSPITRTVTPATTKTFSARVTDSNGCSADSDPVTIEVESPVPPPPPLIITASLRADPKCICSGGSSLLKLKITGGTPPFTIRWPDGKVTGTRKRTAFHRFFTSRDRNVRVCVTDENGLSMLSNAVTIKVFPNCCQRSTKHRVLKPCTR